MIGKPTEIKETSLEADIESESKIELEKRVEVDITSDEFMENELEYMRRMIEEK